MWTSKNFPKLEAAYGLTSMWLLKTKIEKKQFDNFIQKRANGIVAIELCNCSRKS